MIEGKIDPKPSITRI